MTCPNCGAPARLDRERGLMVCDYCGSQDVPPADADGVQVTGETTWACPVCHTAVSTGRIETLDLLYCTACHGILVSMDDIGLLLKYLREHRSRAAAFLTPEAGADSAQYLHCPLCQGVMDHHAYGGGDVGSVMIDSCEACCQVWLHRGALGRILSGTEPDPAPHRVDSNVGSPADLAMALTRILAGVRRPGAG
jgi:Zn-finger nucleic acid-binding protein